MKELFTWKQYYDELVLWGRHKYEVVIFKVNNKNILFIPTSQKANAKSHRKQRKSDINCCTMAINNHIMRFIFPVTHNFTSTRTCLWEVLVTATTARPSSCWLARPVFLRTTMCVVLISGHMHKMILTNRYVYRLRALSTPIKFSWHVLERDN